MTQTYTKYNTVHVDSVVGKLISALPDDDSGLTVHRSVQAERDVLFDLLNQLRKERPANYFGEIYSKILKPGPMRANYASAARFTSHTPVDNKTRYFLQLTLLR
jgi:hypothetical protein